jgi:tetratricopeptide (TPR) repeat protein
MKDPYELFDGGQRLFLKGKYMQSIEKFSQAMEAGHEPGIVYLSLGVAYLKLNDWDRAIRNFDKAIEIDAGNAAALYYRGAALMLKEDYAGAVYDFSRAIEIQPEHRAAIFARGVSYVNMGKVGEGSRDIKRVMSYVAAAIQGFSDVNGWRAQLDKVIAAMEGKREEAADLTEREIETLKKWLKAA